MFNLASDAAFKEFEERKTAMDRRLRFGVDFLDDALRGIFPDDLILLGAPSGVGKTQLCCNIAQANLEDGKQVHYIALEAGQFEIERRLKYPLVFERFLADPHRPSLGRKLNFPDWLLGVHAVALAKYEAEAAEYFSKAYQGLHLYYKTEKFGLAELIESVCVCAEKTDLIIIDHVHYFDFEDDNENRAMKQIAKTVRTLALEEQKPIVLVAHLRKRDRYNDELCADMEEFHGSSDLFKIATRVITVSPGKMTPQGTYETFFRIPKNRLDGGVTRFLGREFYSPKKAGYETGKYQLGWASQSRKEGFGTIDERVYPDWARRPSATAGGSISDPVFTRKPASLGIETRERFNETL